MFVWVCDRGEIYGRQTGGVWKWLEVHNRVVIKWRARQILAKKDQIRKKKKTANQMKRWSTGAASQQKRICVTEFSKRPDIFRNLKLRKKPNVVVLWYPKKKLKFEKKTDVSFKNDGFNDFKLRKKNDNQWDVTRLQHPDRPKWPEEQSTLGEYFWPKKNNKKTAGATVQVTGVLYSTGTSEGVGLDQSGQFVHIVIAQNDAGVVQGT